MNNQKGQVFILAIIVLGLLIINTLILIGGSFLFKENTRYSTSALQATNLAEAGIDKAVATLNATGGSYSGEPETTLGNGSYQVSVTTKDASTKIIQATGYIPNKANATSKKTITIQVSKGVGTSFNYGVQVGDGGLDMSNNSTVNGSVYANGNITMANIAKINGDAYVAGGIQPVADQQSDCTGVNCDDFIFGKVVGGQSQLDVAQSFTPSTTNVLNKVSLKLKKIGSPSDLTVRILGDSSGSPNKNNVLTSGTLTANLVTTSYGFVDVIFSSPPTLSEGSTYWIMIDTSANNSNYWSWSEDTAQGYNGGKAKYSTNWQASTPVWTQISGDLGFQTYMGGVSTSIVGSSLSSITGNAHANRLQNLSIGGGAYYQSASGITAGSLHPGSPDPVAQPMPISDSEITEWKNEASTAGVHTGNITTCPATLPSGSYVGNITLPGNCTVTVGSPIWITGSLNFSGNDTIKLDSSYGVSSGVLIVDGSSTINNNNKLQGSGTTGSYLIYLSTFDSKDDPSGTPAVYLQNNGNSGIIYTNLGDVKIANNNSMTEITAWKLTLQNNVTVNYDQGLASTFFSSGPGGTFSAVKGTYQAK